MERKAHRLPANLSSDRKFSRRALTEMLISPNFLCFLQQIITAPARHSKTSNKCVGFSLATSQSKSKQDGVLVRSIIGSVPSITTISDIRGFSGYKDVHCGPILV